MDGLAVKTARPSHCRRINFRIYPVFDCRKDRAGGQRGLFSFGGFLTRCSFARLHRRFIPGVGSHGGSSEPGLVATLRFGRESA